MEHESPLPKMPAWQARSFWLTVAAALSSLIVMTGIDIFAFLGASDEQSFTDLVMPIVTLVSTVWAWLERRTPTRQLVLK